MKQSEITSYLEKCYPETLASEFDIGKIGLQFGSPNKEIKRILIALDGRAEVVQEAIDKKCDLLITHHPFMFNPLLSVNYDSPFGQKLLKVFQNKLNIYAMHTNFDVAKDGMNEILGSILNLSNLHASKEVIDNSCFLRMGFIKPTTLEDFAKVVQQKFNEQGIKYIGNPQKIIQKVGIVGGAGASEIKEALIAKCDCLVTGEIKHNQALDVLDSGLAIIEVSHSVEALFKTALQTKLQQAFPMIEVLVATNETNPFTVLKN